MASPVETRRGELRSVTLTIPLLSERNTYLVVRLPNEAVQEAVRQARELPEAERPAFLREWVMRNQQAVIEQYVRSGRSERRFRYDVVPVAATRVAEATPRRVIEPNPTPRVEESPHRQIEQMRRVSPDGTDIVPAGWRRLRQGEQLPPDVRVRANQVHLERLTLGDAVVEEFSGTRYLYLKCWHPPDSRNTRRHHGVSVFLQAEPRVIRPTEVQGTREITPPPPVERREIPVAPRRGERQLPPFPSQIKGGNGSAQRPYAVYMSREEVDRAEQEERRNASTTIVTVPLIVTIEGLGQMRFSVSFRAAQIIRSVRSQTQGELWHIIRQTAERVAAERNVRVESSAYRTGIASYNQSFPQIMAQIERADPDLGRYLSSN
jgi:hypothetical protein